MESENGVPGYVCPQCGNDAEIHYQLNGDLMCEVCGWILKEVNHDTEESNKNYHRIS